MNDEVFVNTLVASMRAAKIAPHKQADLLEALADGQSAMANRFCEMDLVALSLPHRARALAFRAATTQLLLEAHREAVA